MKQLVILRRDVEATRIPYGDGFGLKAGEPVELVQMLGGNFTVETGAGRLLRIDARDADALGLAPAPSEPAGEPASGPLDTDRVLEALRTVYDPEIPINVVDLGLIYGCEVYDGFKGKQVDIRMSMTAPGCGMGDVLREDVSRKVGALPGVEAVDVEIVWDPPWDASRMSDAAKLQLGWL